MAAEEMNDVALIVKGFDQDGNSWKEIADLLTHTSAGATFYMPRKSQVGRLVSMMLPLPAHLRLFDHDKEYYRVWGLVQHCQKAKLDEDDSYHLGVAFIGKTPPESYDANPEQNYCISGMNEDGFWTVTKSESDYKARKDMRYWESIGLYLALINEKKETINGERTTTENISRSGAAVFSKLDLNAGDRVKFISEAYDFSGLAVVCNKKLGKDGKTRLHLNFVENSFPIETISNKRKN
jgi:hypothetical protein